MAPPTKKARKQAFLSSLPRDRVFTSSEAYSQWILHHSNVWMDRPHLSRLINASKVFILLNRANTGGKESRWIHESHARVNEEAQEAFKKQSNPCERCGERRSCTLECARRKQYGRVLEVIV